MKIVEANQKAVDALPFESGEWRVQGVAGLFVRCRAATKTYRLERRVDGDLVKRTLEAETLKQAKAAAAREWPRMRPRQAPAGVLTLSLAVEQFLQDKVPQPAPKTQTIHRYNLARYLVRWKDRALEEIGRDRAGLRALQQQISRKHGPSTSNQVTRLLAAVYRWHHDTHPDWPEWPRKAMALHKIKPRDWAYSPDELRAWWSAIVEREGKRVNQGVKTLSTLKRTWWLCALFTGARKGSVEALRWKDVDLDKRVIHFKTAKGEQTYSIPIPDVLADLLTAYRASGDILPSPWVFPSPAIDGTHLVDVKNPKEGVGPAHRLRHTYRTMLAELGASPDQARLLMGHSMGNDVSRGYISSPLLIESLRLLANALTAKYLEILGEPVNI